MVLICQSEQTRERVKVSHVVVECIVINHLPDAGVYAPTGGLDLACYVQWHDRAPLRRKLSSVQFHLSAPT